MVLRYLVVGFLFYNHFLSNILFCRKNGLGYILSFLPSFLPKKRSKNLVHFQGASPARKAIRAIRLLPGSVSTVFESWVYFFTYESGKILWLQFWLGNISKPQRLLAPRTLKLDLSQVKCLKLESSDLLISSNGNSSMILLIHFMGCGLLARYLLVHDVVCCCKLVTCQSQSKSPKGKLPRPPLSNGLLF